MIDEIMLVCVVKNIHFGSVLGYAVFLSEMSEFEQNISLFLKTMGGFGMCFSWKGIWKCLLFKEAKETISENPLVSLYFSVLCKCKCIYIHMH